MKRMIVILAMVCTAMACTTAVDDVSTGEQRTESMPVDPGDQPSDPVEIEEPDGTFEIEGQFDPDDPDLVDVVAPYTDQVFSTLFAEWESSTPPAGPEIETMRCTQPYRSGGVVGLGCDMGSCSITVLVIVSTARLDILYDIGPGCRRRG